MNLILRHIFSQLFYDGHQQLAVNLATTVKAHPACPPSDRLLKVCKMGLKIEEGTDCIIDLPHDKANKMACAPSEDSDQPGHLPSLIRVFAVRMKKAWVLRYPLSAQQRLRSDWVDAQADLSSWAHSHFVGFVVRRLNF